MSGHEVELIDLEDVQVRALAGNLKRKWRPKRVEIALTTKIGLDAEDNRAKIDVDVEVFGREGMDDDAKRVLTYTGSVSLNVIPAEGFKFEEGTGQATSLLAVVWPIARTSLVEHAQRLGQQTLRIPMSMAAVSVELEEDTEAEAEPAGAIGS